MYLEKCQFLAVWLHLFQCRLVCIGRWTLNPWAWTCPWCIQRLPIKAEGLPPLLTREFPWMLAMERDGFASLDLGLPCAAPIQRIGSELAAVTTASEVRKKNFPVGWLAAFIGKSFVEP